MQQKKTRQEIEREINVRVWKDPEFKKNLLSHPQVALEELGIKVPKQVQVHVHEEDSDCWHLTIHKAPPNAKNMSEQELKAQAAAGFITGQCRTICAGH